MFQIGRLWLKTNNLSKEYTEDFSHITYISAFVAENHHIAKNRAVSFLPYDQLNSSHG